jgi:hypothetical protein
VLNVAGDRHQHYAKRGLMEDRMSRASLPILSANAGACLCGPPSAWAKATRRNATTVESLCAAAGDPLIGGAR